MFYCIISNLDPALKKLVRPESVFVSHRKNQTIGYMLVHNNYRPSGSQSRDAERETTAYQIPEAEAVRGTEDAGCCDCGKCYVCKQNFLSPCSQYSLPYFKEVNLQVY